MTNAGGGGGPRFRMSTSVQPHYIVISGVFRRGREQKSCFPGAICWSPAFHLHHFLVWRFFHSSCFPCPSTIDLVIIREPESQLKLFHTNTLMSCCPPASVLKFSTSAARHRRRRRAYPSTKTATAVDTMDRLPGCPRECLPGSCHCWTDNWQIIRIQQCTPRMRPSTGKYLAYSQRLFVRLFRIGLTGQTGPVTGA